jgi:hypothetical protein
LVALNARVVEPPNGIEPVPNALVRVGGTTTVTEAFDCARVPGRRFRLDPTPSWE